MDIMPNTSVLQVSSTGPNLSFRGKCSFKNAA